MSASKVIAKTDKLSPALIDAALNLALAVLYFGSAKFGLALAFQAPQVSAVWPPTGIALSAILLLGYRVWPGIALGAFMANITTAEPTATALGIAAGNTLEALAAAWMLRRAGFHYSLDRLRDVLSLVIFSAILSTMLSATIGTASLALGGVQSWSSYFPLWQLWWSGDGTGALIITPLLLVWCRRPFAFPSWSMIAEVILLLAGLLAACTVIFADKDNNALIYLVFPFIIWAALHFGQRGVTAVTLMANIVAIWATMQGLGSFSGLAAEHGLLPLQLFMGVTSVTGLLLSAAIAESRHTETELAAKLKAMSDLYDYSTKLALAPDLQVALNEVLDAGIAITKADFGNVQILNPEGDGLEIAAHRGFGQDFLDYFKFVPIQHGSSVCGRAAHTGTRFMVEDVGQDPEFLEHRNIARSAGFRAVQSTPLLSQKGALLGMLSTHYRKPCLPTEHDLRMLDLYALQAAHLIERMRAEEALQLADRRKDEFLAILAHELRNPLTPIVSATGTFHLVKADEAKRKALDIIARQAQHMTRLIDDLLDVSRITQGKIILHKQPVSLESVIDNALETARPLLEEHAFDLRLPPETLWLDADPMRLSQIFSNLLNNAAKYTPPGGHIRLEAAVDEAAVLIRIKDTGIGIPPAMLHRIFDPFTQVDSSIERSHGGLGIGLALVKTLVDLHGGAIKAVSDGKGHGSEFIVRLPCIDPPPPSAARAAIATNENPQALRVFVVDDNQSLAQTFLWMLEALGHEARLAHDAESALAVADSFRPDIVILDIGLPKINGYDLCRMLRAQPNLKDSIFVAQTGWGQQEHRDRAKAAGFHHYLVKPVDIEALEQLLSSVDVRQTA